MPVEISISTPIECIVPRIKDSLILTSLLQSAGDLIISKLLVDRLRAAHAACVVGFCSLLTLRKCARLCCHW